MWSLRQAFLKTDIANSACLEAGQVVGQVSKSLRNKDSREGQYHSRCASGETDLSELLVWREHSLVQYPSRDFPVLYSTSMYCMATERFPAPMTLAWSTYEKPSTNPQNELFLIHNLWVVHDILRRVRRSTR
ncbi:hypothetical protein PTI98_004544 [Pleurotus ostreatus]|nr:hypothetical protein PTI98_004544 [Pleurotus ostreatus]